LRLQVQTRDGNGLSGWFPFLCQNLQKNEGSTIVIVTWQPNIERDTRIVHIFLSVAEEHINNIDDATRSSFSHDI